MAEPTITAVYVYAPDMAHLHSVLSSQRPATKWHAVINFPGRILHLYIVFHRYYAIIDNFGARPFNSLAPWKKRKIQGRKVRTLYQTVHSAMKDLLDTAGKEQRRGKLNSVRLALIDAGLVAKYFI